jgi:LysR family glycine cleavage system transcriptional activator
MGDVMPPLNLSRSFEAVARQLSFAKAAGELYLAPGAVNQQIRPLETLFDAKLFNYQAVGGIDRKGLRMLPDVQAGLDMLRPPCKSTATPASGRTLTISLAPSFAAKWLLPRLPGFL